MATKTAAKTPEVVTEKTNLPAALNKPASAALATQDNVPDYLREHGAEGAENINREDVIMPRLGLAQKMSPEVDPESPKFIEGLEIGDFFDSVRKTVFGPGPIEFVILRQDLPRYIEFIPREQGGGIRDFNVPANDPRTQFTTGPDGKRVKPIATKFYDFLIMLLPSTQIIALSLKSTGIKAAQFLKTQIQINKLERKLPVYAAKFMVRSESRENAQGKWKIYVVDNSNIVDPDTTSQDGKGNFIPGLVSKELFDMAKAYFDEFKEKAVVIDVDAMEDGPDRDGQPADPGM